MSAPKGVRTEGEGTAHQRHSDILFGMNILALAGVILMGLTLILNRTGRVVGGLSIGLVAARTALVFGGLYVSDSSTELY
jgi:hypothetical protein